MIPPVITGAIFLLILCAALASGLVTLRSQRRGRWPQRKRWG